MDPITLKIEQLKHYYNLALFLNSSEDELFKALKLIEEYSGFNPFVVPGYEDSPLSGFHPETVRMIIDKEGAYKIKDTVLIFGITVTTNNFFQDCVVAIGNDRGGILIRVFKFIPDKENDEIQQVRENYGRRN
jgi:hypothetical protein